MNIYDFAPLAWALELGYQFLHWLSSALQPLGGVASAGLAIVLLTALIRLLLIPVGVSQLRGELGRRRIAPQLAALQKKYRKNPSQLSEKTLALYKAEGVSMFAGIGPALLQAPVLMVVYGLFVLNQIAGHSNALLSTSFLGAPLGQSLLHLANNPLGLWPALGIFLVVLGIIAAVAEFNRRRAKQQQLSASAPARISGLLQWLPYLTLLTALFVPLAAAIYLACTTLWTALERVVLARWLDRAAKVSAV
ncbi:YidC/Oxa1 family membrane protein insertase [Psychromicrobium lacuslunae]|uniref:Membrane protein insertase YidC n=1 Tax=Psychromicrobium lacuslunae TaxID=1618207 RepID=A0A0D4BZF7_9MICC|nr:membrane protein insertase YidC [Psychromicrobium lacuslunae]AJT41510.1 hypothetical protein UM93_08265 [Psychromicrobium lacuslunae]